MPVDRHELAGLHPSFLEQLSASGVLDIAVLRLGSPPRKSPVVHVLVPGDRQDALPIWVHEQDHSRVVIGGVAELHKPMLPSVAVRIWLDDTRAAPPGWTRTTTVRETLDLLRNKEISEISLDYDLDATDGRHKGDEVLDWIARKLQSGQPVPVVHVHSANPYGAASMSWRINRLEQQVGRQQPWVSRLPNQEPDPFNRVPGGLPDGDVDLARNLLETGALLLDVRSTHEYDEAHLQGAVNVPHDQVSHYVDALDQTVHGDREWAIIVYCVWGRRGAVAKTELMRLGFPNVLNVGGLDGLLGRPLVRGP